LILLSYTTTYRFLYLDAISSTKPLYTTRLMLVLISSLSKLAARSPALIVRYVNNLQQTTNNLIFHYPFPSYASYFFSLELHFVWVRSLVNENLIRL
jgi:hypothetical protein